MDKKMIAPNNEILDLVAKLKKENAELIKENTSLKKQLFKQKKENGVSPGREITLITENDELKKLMEG